MLYTVSLATREFLSFYASLIESVDRSCLDSCLLLRMFDTEGVSKSDFFSVLVGG